MEIKKIEAETANKMTPTELMDAIWEASNNSITEINAVDPNPQAEDNDGVYLEVVKLDDEESVVRDRWPNQDNHRVLVRTKDIYSIYRALVDQVEEVA